MKTATQTSSETRSTTITTAPEELKLLKIELDKLELEKLKLSKILLYLQFIQLLIFIPLGVVLLVLLTRHWDKILQLLG
ncbi:hypothetical protein ACRWQM_15995 [Shewanella sp. HL-SH5]|uniref:hypothetical protein n=1 Tax=Shewanella sp. HL-SH5 TaxID=3436241 RepID=UPI003EBB0B36